MLAPLIAALLLSSARAESAAPNSPPAACTPYLSAPIPKGDLPAKNDAAKLAGCKAGVEYYTLDGDAPAGSFTRVRKCAYLGREAGAPADHLDDGVLMMVYAGGLEVPRNLDLALRFACESGLSGDEKSKWVGYFENVRRGKAFGKIDFCERFFEDHFKEACTDLRKKSQEAQRQKKFKALSSGFTAEQKEKFVALINAAKTFFPIDALWKNPGHATGEALRSLIEAHEAFAWEQFEIWLERLERQKHLKVPAEQLQVQELDERLNKKYRDYRHGLPDIEKEKLTRAEKQWIAFRDAFVEFAVSRYQPKDDSAWNAELTLRRIEELTF